MRRAFVVGAIVLIATVGAGTRARAQTGVLVYAPNSQSNTVSTYTAHSDGTLSATGTVNVGTTPQAVGMRGDQAYAYVANTGDNTVSVIDTASRTVVQTIATGNSPRSLTIGPDGSRLFVPNFNGSSVSVYTVNATTGQLTLLNTIALTTNSPFSLAVTPDGKTLYVVSSNQNKVSVVDVASGTTTTTISVGNSPLYVAINPAGTTAYVTNSTSTVVSVIDMATNTVSASVTVGPVPTGVLVAPDGLHWYVAVQNNNAIGQYDTATNTAVAAQAASGQVPLGLGISPDGKTLYVGDRGSDDRMHAFSIDATTGALTSIGTTAAGNDPWVPGVCGNGNALLASGKTFLLDSTAAFGCFGTSTPTFTGGTMVMNAAGLSISQNISLSSGGTINTNGNPATFSGAFSGSGGLTKTGTNTLTLTGSSNYSGNTNVNGGTLRVTGSISGHVVVTGSGSVLGGTGIVYGDAVIQTGGFIDFTEGLRIIAGAAPPTASVPTLSPIADQAILQDHSTSISFTISGPVTASALRVGVNSSNTTLFSNAAGAGSLVTSCQGPACTLTLTPEDGRAGTSVITVSVSDGYYIVSRSFTVTVTGVRPSPPQVVLVNPVGSGLAVTWTAPDTPPLYYAVAWGTAYGRADLALQLVPGSASRLDIAAVPNGTYFFRVYAVGAGGVGTASVDFGLTVTTGTSVPGPPLAIQATATGGSVTASWSVPSLGVAPTLYEVRIGSTLGGSDIASVTTIDRSLTQNASAGTYWVQSRASNGSVGAWSAPVQVTVGTGACSAAPSAPTLLPVMTPSGQLTFTWLPSGATATQYQLQLSPGAGLAANQFVAVAGTGTSYVARVSGISGAARIVAMNACGTSAPSNEMPFIVP
jgi:YVTN family beta-propeller protein/autotransporter-associated beta strand protein